MKRQQSVDRQILTAGNLVSERPGLLDDLLVSNEGVVVPKDGVEDMSSSLGEIDSSGSDCHSTSEVDAEPGPL